MKIIYIFFSLTAQRCVRSGRVCQTATRPVFSSAESAVTCDIECHAHLLKVGKSTPTSPDGSVCVAVFDTLILTIHIIHCLTIHIIHTGHSNDCRDFRLVSYNRSFASLIHLTFSHTNAVPLRRGFGMDRCFPSTWRPEIQDANLKAGGSRCKG